MENPGGAQLAAAAEPLDDELDEVDEPDEEPEEDDEEDEDEEDDEDDESEDLVSLFADEDDAAGDDELVDDRLSFR